MNTTMDGRKIDSFRCYDDHGNPVDVVRGRHSENPISVNDDIYLSATYHGDRDEFWVVQVSEGGRREKYHNPKSLDFIKFASE